LEIEHLMIVTNYLRHRVYGSSYLFVALKDKKERHKAVEFVLLYIRVDLYRFITRNTDSVI